jgi:protein-tyrosine phosphatase
VKVLFVCMGNICRSSSAHGVFQDLVNREGLQEHFEIDSCGTLDFHTGDAPDPRSQKTAKARGFDISYLRARQFNQHDFKHFDYVLAMDNDNLRELHRACPAELRDRIELFCPYATQFSEREVPDPYYGGPQGFEHVFDLVLDASEGLLKHIRERNFT